MLVLSRKEGESIVIKCGDKEIIIKVIDFRGDGIRLGVKADRSIDVVRAELIGQKLCPRCSEWYEEQTSECAQCRARYFGG